MINARDPELDCAVSSRFEATPEALVLKKTGPSPAKETGLK
jgi:hypothetical protein